MKRFAIALMLWCSPAMADAPRVVTDIAPVHSLVSMVMEGIGEPVLLLNGSSNPHGGALRPSQARALAGADTIIWMGAGLTPWLADPVSHSKAQTLALLALPKTKRLPLREEFDDHGHDDHDHGHGDDEIDPHAWLDPMNAINWMTAIASQLSDIDPSNAERYTQNMEGALTALTTLSHDVETILTPVRDFHFAVDHDAFHYFEDRFGMMAAIAHSSGDGDKPGPQRMRAMLSRLAEKDIKCLFVEPDSSQRMIARLEGMVRVARLDPLGTTLQPGPGLYPALIKGMATDMAECLSQ